MRNARKWLSLLLALALVAACLPQVTLPAKAADEKYDIWVGGVRVDSANAGDVLGDGKVVFTPAAGSEPAKLTLNGASIPGAFRPGRTDSAAGIYAEEDLTLELHGASAVNGTDADASSFGILINGYRLTVTGDGILDVTAGDGSYSCAISTNSMIIRSGTIRATAGKASGESEGVYSNSFTMEGGALVATGGEAPKSWGVGGSAAVNGGTVTAIGQTRAFWMEPDLSGYADPDVRVITEADYPQFAEAWNGTDDLGGDGSNFQCVIIEPAGYDLWVGGVLVTDDNKADVLGDGTVVFTPATDSEQAKLTLNGAEIIGAPVPAWPNDSDGIYTEEDLTLELHGENTITANNAWEGGDSLGIFAGDCSLIVTGDGILNVTTGEGRLSCGVCSFGMTMRSGTLLVTAGKATERSSGVYSLSFTMEGGTLITEAGEAPDSRGFDCISTFNGGTIVATGHTSALYIAPKLSGDAAPVVMVNTEPTEIGAKTWNGTDDLSKDGSFKYVRIEPAAGYDVWVGGVRVTEANKGDVLGDGTVVFTPATESEQAKLTLNNAEITGAVRPDAPNSTAGIYAGIDLTLELHGSSTVTGTDTVYNYGILINGHRLTVTGSGTLDVTAGDGSYSCAISTYSMIMRSGTVRAASGKASGVSEGVYSNSFTMEGGALVATGGEAPKSRGVGGSAAINGGTVTAIGQTRAFNYEPDLSGYADPDVRVNTDVHYLTWASAWNGTDDLGGDGSSFQCVIIEPAGYDLWVGGVRVTEANKADVLGDGTVAFTPATESEQAKLTLNGADITGAPVPALPHDSDGIYSDIDLTMELHGKNTVTANDAWEGGDSLGIFAGDCSLIVTGDGILNVTTGEGRLSCGVDTSIMTMRSGTLRATAGKATSVSDGVYSLYFTMEGGTLITEAGEAPESWGFVGQATINGGTIEATGQRSAFYREPDLSGYADPDVRVNTATSATGATAWNGTDALGGDGSSFKYVSIESAGYDLWVGGVRVTEANKADVLGDGAVVFTPATESGQAKLTLNNAKITGAVRPDQTDSTVGVYAKMDLTLELVGSNEIIGTDASYASFGILVSSSKLTVIGGGTLDVSAGDGFVNSGISAVSMIMRGGTIRATAGKASYESEAVFTNGFTMEGGTLIAEGGEASISLGLYVSAPIINGGTVVAVGQTCAFYREPNLSGYADPDVRVNTEPSETGAKEWNGTDDLSDDGSFKYVRISRKADPTPPELENPFIDVKKGTYYYDAVLWAVNAKPQVTSGTSYNTFSPNATCTRAQVVTFLWRAKGCPEPEMDAAASPFTDVREGSYYFKAVLWAVENKITKGTSATTFSPDQGCTRGQVVTFLHRFAGTPAPGSDANPFVDVKEGAFYYDAVLWAVEKNVTKGTTATTFSPNDTCTRGQIVTFLYRAMK